MSDLPEQLGLNDLVRIQHDPLVLAAGQPPRVLPRVAGGIALKEEVARRRGRLAVHHAAHVGRAPDAAFLEVIAAIAGRGRAVDRGAVHDGGVPAEIARLALVADAGRAATCVELIGHL